MIPLAPLTAAHRARRERHEVTRGGNSEPLSSLVSNIKRAVLTRY